MVHDAWRARDCGEGRCSGSATCCARREARLLSILIKRPKRCSGIRIETERRRFGGLLNFLACSFHGGTDVAEPLRCTVERLQETAWQRADMLFISDGEFDVAGETMAIVRGSRASSSSYDCGEREAMRAPVQDAVNALRQVRLCCSSQLYFPSLPVFGGF